MRKRFTGSVIASCLLIVVLGLSVQWCRAHEQGQSRALGDEPNEQVLAGFVTYCADCHGHYARNGAADWNSIKADASEIVRRMSPTVRTGAMPPANARQVPRRLQQAMRAAAAEAQQGRLGGPDDTGIHVDQIRLPEGFRIELYARARGARSMVMSPSGTLFVGTGGFSDVDPQGRVYAIRDTNGDNVGDEVVAVASRLNNPNGVAFKDGNLYIAEISRILKLENIESRLNNPPRPQVVYNRLPTDRHHGWKYIAFGPDGKLYIPVGAPCNVCDRDSEPGRRGRYARIFRLDVDRGSIEEVARGVRNTVGFDWHPQTGELWFTDNGRDNLGDNTPPDELNRVTSTGQHFGFPHCHGRNIRDPQFGNRACSQFQAPVAELGPHVAALGMAFYTGDQFPAAYRNQVFIAEHGSWNRRSRIGYRISLVTVDSSGRAQYRPFAEGWLQNQRRWGRPVDVIVAPDGALLISDDKAGAIYRISFSR